MSLHIVGHTLKVTLYKHLVGVVSTGALMHIAKEFDRVKHMDFDTECGFVLRATHGFSCTCVLIIYDLGIIPLNKVPVMCTRFNFSYISSNGSSSELSI